jgi:hypothetical protein
MLIPSSLRRGGNTKTTTIGTFSRAVFGSLLRSIVSDFSATADPPATLEDENNLDEAREQASAIARRLDLGSWEASHRKLSEELSQTLWEGERALERQIESLELNFERMIYRELKLTAVHVPTHASRDTTNALSLTNVLKEAHKSFRLGLPLATIALCRTACEIVIRDYYKIDSPEGRFLRRFKNAEQDPAASRHGADKDFTKWVQFAADATHAMTPELRYGTQPNLLPLPTDIATIERVAFHLIKRLLSLVEGIPAGSP